MKIIALICARGNSRGIKNKNLLKFKNTTLLGLYMLVGNNLFLGDFSSTGNYPTSVYTSVPLVKQ